MKRSITFSIDDKIAARYQSITGENRNIILEGLLENYIKESKMLDTNQPLNTDKKCDKCGSVFSNKLAECPECKMKDNLQDFVRTKEQLKDRLGTLERLMNLYKQQNRSDRVAELEIEIKEIKESLEEKVVKHE